MKHDDSKWKVVSTYPGDHERVRKQAKDVPEGYRLVRVRYYRDQLGRNRKTFEIEKVALAG